MKKSNIVLGLSIGFAILAVISCFINISIQTIVTLSICSLLFTAAQTIQSFVSESDEETQKKYDCFKELGNFKIDEKLDYVYKKYSHVWFSDKKRKYLIILGNILEIFAFIILLLGLIIPISIFEYKWITDLCTFLSFSLLFLNIWLVEKIKSRASSWCDIKFINMFLKENKDTEDENNG